MRTRAERCAVSAAYGFASAAKEAWHATRPTHLVKTGLPTISLDDEICRDTLVAHGGELVHPKVRERAGLPPLSPVTPTQP